MKLEVGKVYKSLAGCPVRLLEILPNRSVDAYFLGERSSQIARVEYVDEVNNYGYGKGAIGMFYASDLREWNGDSHHE